MAVQGALKLTKMCAAGFVSGSESSVPRRSLTSSGLAAIRLIRGEPQRVQKQRNWPGDDSNLPTRDSPSTKRKSLVGTDAFVAKEAPEAFRHWPQWQWTLGPSLPLIS